MRGRGDTLYAILSLIFVGALGCPPRRRLVELREPT